MKRVNLCDLEKVTVEVPKEFAFCLTSTQQILWLYDSILDIMENGGGGGGTFDVTIGDNGNWYINGVDTGKPSRGEQGPQGEPGADGKDGAEGPRGPQGPAGADGAPGPEGPRGPQGPAGADGAPGPEGPQGPAGADGAPGPEGPQGPQGEPGANGKDGAPGADGYSPTVVTETITNGTRVTITDKTGAHTFDILNGKDGGAAATPTIGDNGNWYINGTDTGKPSRGEQGPKGERGPQGPAGADGEDGAQGPQGPEGPQGPAGKDGAQGPQGDPGPQGERGPQGPAGEDGAQGPEGPQGPKGPAGADGAQGERGPAGADGFSPTVATEAITNGTRVTITDAEGPHSFDVLNGTGGGGATTPLALTGRDLYSLFQTPILELADNGTDYARIRLLADVINVTGELEPDTGKVSLEFTAAVGMGKGNPVAYGVKYDGTDGTYPYAISKFNTFYPGNVSEAVKLLNGMTLDGIYVYKGGALGCAFKEAYNQRYASPTPNVPEKQAVLVPAGLEDGATVAKGDTVTVKIRGHIAPAL